MTRFALPLVLCALTCALVCVPVCAEDPPKKLTKEEREKLEARSGELNAAGVKAHRAGHLPEAIKAFEESLAISRQVYSKAEYPDGHEELAVSLFNLAAAYIANNQPTAAEPHIREAVDVFKRLYKGDHPRLAGGLSYLGALYRQQGRLAEAGPFLRDTMDMQKRLHKGDHLEVARSLNNLAILYTDLGRLSDAAALFADALAMSRRLYKGDHPLTADCLNNLAMVIKNQGQPAAAAPLLVENLEMLRRLYKGDHPAVARTLSNLGMLYLDQGKLTEAEALFAEALEAFRRLYKGDHPTVATSLNNLALARQRQHKLAAAAPLYKDALDMQKRLYKGDHPGVAAGLSNLALLLSEQGKSADAVPLLVESLAMSRRVFKDDNPALATAMNNLALVYLDVGKSADAAPLLRDALAMRRRLHGGDHPAIALGLNNLARLHRSANEPEAAVALLREALAVSRRLTAAFARQTGEGAALTLAASLPLYRDSLIGVTLPNGARPADVYVDVWADKGAIARVYEQRLLRSRAATTPAVAAQVAELASARRARAEVLFAPATRDRATRDARAEELKTWDAKIVALEGRVRPHLPAVARTAKLDAAAPAELQRALPAGAAVVDFLRFALIDADGPGDGGQFRYLAFVVTKDAVAWVDLDTAAVIEPAVGAWRDGITAGKEIPPAMAAKVRELVWAKVRKELPAGTTTVYVCPDAALCKLPFAAIPGDKPNTVLLDDYAIATIPHAPFLLDKLWPQDERKNPPTDALVVGDVKYDAAVTAKPNQPTASGPLFKPDAKPIWKPLPNTAGEANGIVAAAGRKKLAATRIDGDKATPAAVLAALPEAKYAHFATHGFFADASFRSALQLDPKDYENRGGERVGRAALSPLVMTGLVFAGANNPDAPGRGIITGEQLIDLDLSGLELAVLSACETGLGDVAGGQGVFGLQRAFHYAGATNVVCSLWKVPDEPTAALMGAFYTNLWDKGMAPMEALRRAQLEVYRNPGKIPALAKGFRGVFEEVEGSKVEAKPGANGTAHPLLWAAFTLSGPGK